MTPTPDAVRKTREDILRAMHKPMSMVLDAEEHKRTNATRLAAFEADIRADCARIVREHRNANPEDSGPLVQAVNRLLEIAARACLTTPEGGTER